MTKETDLMNDLCQRFEQHVIKFEKHEEEEGAKFDKLIEAQKINTAAVSELTRSVSSLVDDTSSVIQLHKDFQGAARVGRGVQDFMIWCLKWGAIGTGVVTVVMFVVGKFQH